MAASDGLKCDNEMITENLEEEYETISINEEYEQDLLEEDEVTINEKPGKQTEGSEVTDDPVESPEQKNTEISETKLYKRPRVQPLVIPGEHLKIPGRPAGMRPPYRYQLELQVRGRPLLLFEAYSSECCVWQPGKGRILLYIPRACRHERSKEWYVYPAMRLFPGQAKLMFNLELASKFKGVFDASTCNFAENFLQVAYRRARKKGIVMAKGILFGYLYIHELWEEHPANIHTGQSLYCPICEKVGHVASNCMWRIENRQNRNN